MFFWCVSIADNASLTNYFFPAQPLEESTKGYNSEQKKKSRSKVVYRLILF